FVRGRVRLGVGDGITGFSLSLPRAGMSVLLLAHCFLLIAYRSRSRPVLTSWYRMLPVCFESVNVLITAGPARSRVAFDSRRAAQQRSFQWDEGSGRRSCRQP